MPRSERGNAWLQAVKTQQSQRSFDLGLLFVLSCSTFVWVKFFNDFSVFWCTSSSSAPLEFPLRFRKEWRGGRCLFLSSWLPPFISGYYKSESINGHHRDLVSSLPTLSRARFLFYFFLLLLLLLFCLFHFWFYLRPLVLFLGAVNKRIVCLSFQKTSSPFHWSFLLSC